MKQAMSEPSGGRTLGIVMLVHNAFERAEQLARHWHEGGCPIVIHIDSVVPEHEAQEFRDRLSQFDMIRFSNSHRCEWGTWGLVGATLEAAKLLLDSFSEVNHVLLCSGACLPLRPVSALRSFLKTHSDTDYIESVTTAEVSWIAGGLGPERFTFYFPFSWRKQRWLFDKFVDFQRFLGIKREVPSDLEPHMGSQWWCLTRATLSAILNDPKREEYEKYFRQVWIPDESYFQTLARKHSTKIESRSLTLAKFDYQGKPYVFYDDHLPLLRRSDCFVARKIWRHADQLYDQFLNNPHIMEGVTPNPSRIDRIFSQAIERRTRGRAGLYMQSRFPVSGREIKITAARYVIFEGFSDILDGFEHWLEKHTQMAVHGHLFAPERVEFRRGQQHFAGALSDSAALRDYNPIAFLTNLIWNGRGTAQCFQFGPQDRQQVMDTIYYDTNATLFVISGAWAVALFHSDLSDEEKRKEAARLQERESRHLAKFRDTGVKAQVTVWSLSEFVKTPREVMRTIAEHLLIPLGRDQIELPEMRSLDGFAEFLQDIKNKGTTIYLPGDFSSSDPVHSKPVSESRRYYPVDQ